MSVIVAKEEADKILESLGCDLSQIIDGDVKRNIKFNPQFRERKAQFNKINIKISPENLIKMVNEINKDAKR